MYIDNWSVLISYSKLADELLFLTHPADTAHCHTDTVIIVADLNSGDYITAHCNFARQNFKTISSILVTATIKTKLYFLNL